MYILPPHLNQSLAERSRNIIAQQLNHARNLASRSVAAVQKAVKANRDSQRQLPPNFCHGDLVMAIKPQISRHGKLARIYDGPFKVEDTLPTGRTLRLTKVSNGEVRLAHVDNVKRFIPADELRHTAPLEDPVPTPSVVQERRAIEMLQRAAAQAKHIVGAPRARAVASDVLGYLQLPSLPTELPSTITKQSTSTTPILPSPEPAPPPVPPPTPPLEPLPWGTKQPWFFSGPLSASTPATRTKSGRAVRVPQRDNMVADWIDFNTES